MAKVTWNKGIPLDESLQIRLRAFIREIGNEEAAAQTMGIGVSAIVRAAAGLGLRRGTIRVIEIELDKRAKASAA